VTGAGERAQALDALPAQLDLIAAQLELGQEIQGRTLAPAGSAALDHLGEGDARELVLTDAHGQPRAKPATLAAPRFVALLKLVEQLDGPRIAAAVERDLEGVPQRRGPVGALL